LPICPTTEDTAMKRPKRAHHRAHRDPREPDGAVHVRAAHRRDLLVAHAQQEVVGGDARVGHGDVPRALAEDQESNAVRRSSSSDAPAFGPTRLRRSRRMPWEGTLAPSCTSRRIRVRASALTDAMWTTPFGDLYADSLVPDALLEALTGRRLSRP
jgi:hypothetical protein